MTSISIVLFEQLHMVLMTEMSRHIRCSMITNTVTYYIACITKHPPLYYYMC